MSRYNYCDTTDRIYFKKDAKTAKELIISEDACDRLNDLERQLEEANATIERMKENERERYKSASKALGILPPNERLKEKGDETR